MTRSRGFLNGGSGRPTITMIVFAVSAFTRPRPDTLRCDLTAVLRTDLGQHAKGMGEYLGKAQ